MSNKDETVRVSHNRRLVVDPENSENIVIRHDQLTYRFSQVLGEWSKKAEVVTTYEPISEKRELKS